MTPLSNILHRSTIEALVGKDTLARGEAYYREGRVGAVTRKASSVEATVRGTSVYAVRIWVSADGLAYACTCGFAAKGNFCKHAIATAVAWLEQTRTLPSNELSRRLRAMGKADLVDLVLGLAGDADVRSRIETALGDE